MKTSLDKQDIIIALQGALHCTDALHSPIVHISIPMAQSILDVLTEQKSVADYTTHNYPIFQCGACGFMIDQWKYCPVCGNRSNEKGVMHNG